MWSREVPAGSGADLRLCLTEVRAQKTDEHLAVHYFRSLLDGIEDELRELQFAETEARAG